MLNYFGVFAGFIDNAAFMGSKNVYGIDVFFETKKYGWIILCASNEHRKEMMEQLKKEKRCGDTFYIYECTDFFTSVFPILSVYALNRLYDNLCQISLTERCTLRCEKCAHGCWAVKGDSADMEVNEVYRTVAWYFNTFDYVQEFVLIGGEPLLYRYLAEVVSYIGERYRQRINTFAITTNGTLLPDRELLDVCRRYKVHFHISNYSKTITWLSGRYQELCNRLEDNGIEYELSNSDDTWMDYGFDYLTRGETEDLIKVFDECKTPCREVRENRYYYCVQARTVSENMGFNIGEDDYLDMNEIQGIDGKKVLLEFCMGYSGKGYLEMCKHCYGAEAKQHIIPRAVQKKI